MARGTRTDEVRITHELLAATLGVQRPGVTLALRELQKDGLVKSRRGAIEIVARLRMEAAACECYRELNNRYEKLMT
jgi:DNA-binding GntR family transcriptional regulator